LSILGGVQVLGPVGILVGPMLVSFLQALLNMLRKELDSFGGAVVDPSRPLAESVADVIQQVDPENADKAAKTAGQLQATAQPSKGSKVAAVARKLGRTGRTKRKR
jgi:hypothetical protein